MINNNERLTNSELIKTKKEINSYIKEALKNFIKFPVIFIKCISILILTICNNILPIALLLFAPTLAIVAIVPLTIINIIFNKKVDNYVEKQYINEVTQISEKINDDGYNLGASYRKLKKLQEISNQQEKNLINLEQILDTPKPTYDGLVYEAFAREEIRHLQNKSEHTIPKTIFAPVENIEEQIDTQHQEQSGPVLTKKLIPPKHTRNK